MRTTNALLLKLPNLLRPCGCEARLGNLLVMFTNLSSRYRWHDALFLGAVNTQPSTAARAQVLAFLALRL